MLDVPRPGAGHGDEDVLAYYWDALAAGQRPPQALDPALIGTIRAFHQAGAEAQPTPDPTFVQDLLGELMHNAPSLSWNPLLVTRADTFHANGRMPRPPASVASIESGAGGVRWGAYVATAALVAVVLIGSVAAFRIGRGGGDDARPIAIPAFGEAVASPVASDEAPIARFLWQTAGGPEAPFAMINSWAGTGFPAVAPDGTVWVPDAKRHQIQIFTPNGDYRESWGSAGSAPGEFNFVVDGYPHGAVAFDAAGNIFVADAGNYRIQKFRPDRSFVAAFGSEGASDSAFLDLYDIAIDLQGRVIALDLGTGNLEVFANDGNWVATWGRRGAGPGELNSPSGLAVDRAGNIWVADAGRNQIVQFSPSGEPTVVWDDQSLGKGVLIGPLTLEIDAQGRVYVADSGYRVQVLTPDGKPLGAWGRQGDAEGEFRLPVGLALGNDGTVYVTDGYLPRVQAFRTELPLITAPTQGTPSS